MKKDIIAMIRSWGYWRIAYSGHTRTFYIKGLTEADMKTVPLTLDLYYGDLPFKFELQ